MHPKAGGRPKHKAPVAIAPKKEVNNCVGVLVRASKFSHLLALFSFFDI